MTYTPAELFEFIKNRKEPIEVVRMGDGEARILDRDYDMVLKRQLGYLPESKECEQIRENLIIAYANADIIGMPQNKRAGLSDYWYRCEEILYKACPNAESKDKTNIDFAYDWLNNNLYGELLTGRDTLNYVSSRDLSDRFSRYYGVKDVKGVHISPEAKFSILDSAEKHFPDQLNEIGEWISHDDFTGQLCLVGAGVVGKIYTTWFKEKGGIALDIGGVFDLWAGLATRGKNRGVGAIDNTYKL